jgi:tetratricopeptide (TPR) repeat protein
MIRAVEIEPDSPLYHADLGQAYYFDRRYDAAVTECQKALEIDPEFLFTNKYLIDIYLAKGDEKEALKYSLAYAKVIGASQETLRRAQEIFDTRGFRGSNESEIDTALSSVASAGIRDHATFSLQLADAYSRIGDAPNTLRWLQETVQSPPDTWPFTVAYIGVEPRFAFLRKHAEFQAILEKLNFKSAVPLD